MTHDQLQAQCFLFLWNEHPELRYLCFSSMNNLTTQLPDKEARRVMAIRKSLGMVKGVLDLIFYYRGRMYAFDIKVGKDKLKPEQLEFIAAIAAQGGYGCEIRSFEEFKSKIDEIIKSN